MHKLFTVGLLSLVLMVSACSHTLDIPYKGTELNSLEQAANYISAKNISKKLVASKIHLLEKPFLLGAYDLRDDIPSRVPEESYSNLLETLQKEALPLTSNTTPPTLFTDAPEGLRSGEERVSYLTARAIAKSFGKNGIPVMPTSMAIGLADAQVTTPPKISAKEEKELLVAINEKLKRKKMIGQKIEKTFTSPKKKHFFQ